MKVTTINILCSLVIHFQPLYNNWLSDVTTKKELLALGIARGLALLAYPICGWIAEVNNCQGKMIKWSFLVNMTGAILIVISITIGITLPFSAMRDTIEVTILCIAVIVGLTGLGMYEANIIQFGMDQMMDASSEQLGSFIHWYFWSVHFGNLFAFYIAIGVYVYVSDCKVHQGETLNSDLNKKFFNYYASIIAISFSIVQILAVIFGYIVTSWSRLHHIENQQSRNSLKIIFQVLKYSYEHKYPEQRSAFTYWENDIPSRIDLGKEKYGGPFTYEQVEDVKTFFRLLLLILSLFGFHILGNGYSLSHYIMNTVGCPTLVPLMMIIANPEHIPIVIIVIGVPLFQCIQKYFPRFMPNMLNRLWLGLVLSLITEATQVLYTLLLVPKDFDCSNHAGLFTEGNQILKKCLLANTKVIMNKTCNHFCNDPPVSTNLLPVYLSVIPFALQGLSYLLIFMTILEFICAQSPNALKGLLIGIWYSTTSIKFPLIHLLDTDSSTSETIPWNIYHGIKGIGIFLSIISFSSVYRYYRYRERNEIVNEQNIIEEQYERELLMNQSEDTDSSSDEDDKLVQNYTKNE